MNNSMIKSGKVFLLMAATAGVLVSCSGGGEANGKLDELRQRKDSLKEVKNSVAAELTKLEIEIKKLDTSANERIPLVKTEVIAESQFRHYFEVQGVVETDKNATINPEASAKIISIAVKEGQNVTKGQLLMTLDSKVIKNNMSELKTQTELAQTVYNKQKSLWDQKIGSEIQYLEAKSNLESLKGRMETMNSQLEMYNIRAPFAGIVDEIFPKVGEMASPMAPVMRIVNLTEVYIKADVSERYLSIVKVGDVSVIQFPSLNYEKNSTITRIGNFINPNNRSFKVRFELSNEKLDLKPNLLAKVRIMDYSNEKSIIVPTKVIQENPSGDEFVYMLSENGSSVAKKQMVKTGMSYLGQIEVIEGLNAGDMIITQGGRSIKDGDIVEAIEN